MELLKKKFLNIRHALMMGDSPLNEVFDRYSIKRLNAALAAYKETPTWDDLVALMAKCKKAGRFSLLSYSEPYAKMHLMYLGLARTEAEAKKIYDEIFI